MSVLKSLDRFWESSIFFLVLLITSGCAKTEDRSFDFTEEGLFTPGIEGPAVDSKGRLFAVNFNQEGTIGVVDTLGIPSVYAELPNGSIGNGIRFDRYDNMYIADYVNHNVLLIPTDSTEASVFAHHDELNQPNDLAIRSDGVLFASDPNWAEETGKLWRIDEGGFHLLEDEMGTTNGIEVSTDEKHLYVNESVQRKIWRYSLDSAGNIGDKTLFYEFNSHGLDGMRCDAAGNLYVCRYDAGKVVVISPDAKIIREIQLKGMKPSNIAFGGKDGKQCFVTMADRGCFESFFAEFSGKKY